MQKINFTPLMYRRKRSDRREKRNPFWHDLLYSVLSVKIPYTVCKCFQVRDRQHALLTCHVSYPAFRGTGDYNLRNVVQSLSANRRGHGVKQKQPTTLRQGAKCSTVKSRSPPLRNQKFEESLGFFSQCVPSWLTWSRPCLEKLTGNWNGEFLWPPCW
jgi:hypothetical protein